MDYFYFNSFWEFLDVKWLLEDMSERRCWLYILSPERLRIFSSVEDKCGERIEFIESEGRVWGKDCFVNDDGPGTWIWLVYLMSVARVNFDIAIPDYPFISCLENLSFSTSLLFNCPGFFITIYFYCNIICALID